MCVCYVPFLYNKRQSVTMTFRQRMSVNTSFINQPHVIRHLQFSSPVSEEREYECWVRMRLRVSVRVGIRVGVRVSKTITTRVYKFCVIYRKPSENGQC